ncbi:MAG: 2'-5' RNA ligase family protein [Bacillota bacterium]
MLKPISYSVVIIPPPPVRTRLVKLRRLSPLLDSALPPHITVKSPFFLRQTGARVLEQIRRICSTLPSFPIQLKGIGSFESTVIYVQIVPSQELVTLHTRLEEALAGYVEPIVEEHDPREFSPHLTLASKLSPAEFSKLRALLSGRTFEWEFSVDRVYLLSGPPRSRIERSVELLH